MRNYTAAILGIGIILGGMIVAPMGTAAQTTNSLSPVQQAAANQAAGLTNPINQALNNPNSGQNAVQQGSAATAKCVSNPSDPTCQQAYINAQVAAANQAQSPTTCSFLNPFSTACLNTAGAWFAALIIWVFGWLVWVAGVFLNAVVGYSVINISAIFNTGNGAGAINGTWALIRDLLNMSFIFIILWIGIKTVLGLSAFDKALIIKIIAAAVLINFSLFFTKVTIDAADIVSLPFYNAMVTSTCTTSTLATCAGAGGISNAFMNTLQLTTIFQTQTTNGTTAISANATAAQAAGSAIVNAPTGLTFGQYFIIGMMSAILLSITAFVFFAAGLLFITRLIVLIFVAILSPIAFVGMMLPNLKKYSEMWLNALIGQAFFAPVYFILTFIGVAVLSNLLPTIQPQNGNGFGTLASGNVNSIGIVITFSIAIAFIVAALMIAKRIASQGGGLVTSVIKAGQKYGGAAIFGGTGFAARTLSRGTDRLTQASLSEAADKKNTGFRAGAARLALRTTDLATKQSFDARNARIPKTKVGFQTLDKTINSGEIGDGYKKAQMTLYQRQRTKTAIANTNAAAAVAANAGGVAAQQTATLNSIAQSIPKAPQPGGTQTAAQPATAPIAQTVVPRPQNTRGTVTMATTPIPQPANNAGKPGLARVNAFQSNFASQPIRPPVTGTPLVSHVEGRPEYKAPAAPVLPTPQIPRPAMTSTPSRIEDSSMAHLQPSVPPAAAPVASQPTVVNNNVTNITQAAPAAAPASQIQYERPEPAAPSMTPTPAQVAAANDGGRPTPTPPAAPAIPKNPMPEAPGDDIRAIRIDKAA